MYHAGKVVPAPTNIAAGASAGAAKVSHDHAAAAMAWVWWPLAIFALLALAFSLYRMVGTFRR